MNTRFETGFVQDWWDRVRAGEKLVQKCNSCGHLQMHPRRLCNDCASPDHVFVPVSGKAKIYSFTTIYHNAPSDFVGDVPYTLAMVDVAEGPRMLSRIVNCAPEVIRCDMPVSWVMAQIGGKAMPCFQPA